MGRAAWRGLVPPEDERAQRVEIAVATHMLVSGPVHNVRTEQLSRAALGVTGSGWTTRRLAYGRGVTADAATRIRDLAHALVDEGLVDYTERRQLLGDAPGLAHRLQDLLRSWDQHAAVTLEAVETWLWVAATRSPPWEDFLLEPALEIDRRLDPEQRLTLHAMVGEYLVETTQPDLLVVERRKTTASEVWEEGA